MFSPVPLINRIDRLKESENRITLDEIWDYPVSSQRFSMWSTQPPHLRNTPSFRPAGRGFQHPTPSSSLPSSSPAETGKPGLNPPSRPCAPTASHTRANLPSALRFAISHPPSPPCAHVRRSAQHGRPSPITSRTPRGPQKAGPSDAKPSSLKWRIPVRTDADQVGVVPSIVITPPENAGDMVCPSSSSPPSSDSTVDGEKATKAEDGRTQYLRRTTTRILGPEKSEPSPTSKNNHPTAASSPPSDNNSDPTCSDLMIEEDFTLPEDYASTLRLSIVHCPRRKRAWRVVERCLDGVWRRLGW